jgi:hypothetical protein
VILNPGETLLLDLGTLARSIGYLVLRSYPPGDSATYQIDGTSYFHPGADRIENLPLHSLITVILHKSAFADKTNSIRLERSGDVLDFGTLQRLWGPLTVRSSPTGASVRAFIDGQATYIQDTTPMTLPRVPLGAKVNLEITAPNHVTQNLVHVLSGPEDVEYVTLQEVPSQPDPGADLIKKCQDAVGEIASRGQFSPSQARAALSQWKKWKEENQSAFDSSQALRDAYDAVVRAINLNRGGVNPH